MRRRHSPRLRQFWPRLWLMTDERMGDALLPSIAALPRGSGIIFRHYHAPDRKRLYAHVKRLAKARRLILILAGPERDARQWRADGSHTRRATRPSRLRTAPVHTAPVHSVVERIAAERAGADLLFISPVFATRSHGGAKPLGRMRFARLAKNAKKPVIALGGMTGRRFRSLSGTGAYGWAAIDALTV